MPTLISAPKEELPKLPPEYRKRKMFIPRNESDFGDGGSFPEIHVPQFPLGMGKNKSNKLGGTLALQVDKDGNIQYDALAKQGHLDTRIVHSNYKDLIPINLRDDVDKEAVFRPTEEEIKEVADKTKEALQKIVFSKLEASQPKSVVMAKHSIRESSYIRYTPGQQNEKYNSGAKQRILRIVDMPVDPMEPPRFKHKKIPRGPPSPPAPVLHSPPRKITAQEQQAWVIPPCISNWKNAKGYTIPLDKRLAADGRGLQEILINDKFANLSESLFTAERLAREEIKKRASFQHKLAEKEKLQKEENLRNLAQQARESRAAKSNPKKSSKNRKDSSSESDDNLKERDALRREKQKERERELRLSRMGTDQKLKYLSKNENRDISEKIALGLAKPTYSKEGLFDSRLFNQTEGMDSGFKDEDAYNLYEKPLFTGSSVNSIYKIKGDRNEDPFDDNEADAMLAQDRFGDTIKVKSFKGADATQERDGPVEFEKDDPFGLDQFLSEAKKGKRNIPMEEPSTSMKRSKDR